MTDTSTYKQQAGCVPVRVALDGVHVMLVTNKSGKNWVLPKGTIKHSETAEHAALRETKEEAGLKGDVGSHIGLFHDHKKNYAIHFFSMQVHKEKKQWLEKGTRTRKWFPIEEALVTVKKKYVVEVLNTLKQSYATTVK